MRHREIAGKLKRTMLIAVRVVSVLALAATSFNALASSPARITVEVATPANDIPRTLWGVFFEDINLSADGGIYPELVRNRSFEDSDTPQNWKLNTKDDASEMTI